MVYIDELYRHMKEELIGSQMYAEKYLEHKSKDETQWANRFKEMSTEELKHANYLHEYIVNAITTLKKAYTPTEKEVEQWDKKDRKFYEKETYIKMMLTQ